MCTTVGPAPSSAELLFLLFKAADTEAELAFKRNGAALQLDRERLELIQERMPHYAQVVQAVRERLPREPERARPKVTVTLKRPEPGPGGR